MIMKILFGIIFCILKIPLELHGIPTAVVNPNAQVEDIQERSLQQELKAFYSSLDEEEKVKLKKYAETGALNLFSDGQFLDSLKNEAGGLLVKLLGLKDIISDKLDTMQPESRQFIENLLGRFLVVFSRDSFMNILDDLKTLGKEFISMFNGLPKPAQDDILKAFPAIGSYATSDVARFILQKLAKLDLTTNTSSTSASITDYKRKDSEDQFKKSGMSDREDSIGYGRKESLGSTANSLTDNEEFSFKKVTVNK